MRILRVRKPSLKTVVGVTRAKRRVTKAVGINTMMAPGRAPDSMKRRALRKVGYYSGPMRFFRFLSHLGK